MVRFHPKIGKRYTYDKLLWPETHNSCSGCESYYRASEVDDLRAAVKALVDESKRAHNMLYEGICATNEEMETFRQAIAAVERLEVE